MSFDFRTIAPVEAGNLIAASTDPLLARRSREAGVDPVELAREVRQFFEGDHWQGGAGWVGPKPSNAEGAIDGFALNLIADRFVSRNMIKELVNRQTTGVLGREPRWGLTPKRALKEGEGPTDAEQKQIDEYEAALTVWWDKRECHKLFQLGNNEALISRRAVLRLFVPMDRLEPINPNGDGPGALADDPNAPPPVLGVAASSLEEALDHIYVEVVTADDGGIFTDADSMEKCGVVRYQRQGATVNATGAEIVELSFLDETAAVPQGERDTVVRIATLAESDAGTDDLVSFPLGGRLTHFAIERAALITEQILSLQKALNLGLSMLPRNMETSGFLERIIMNAQLPGEYIDNGDGTRTFVPGHYITGSGTTTFLQGTDQVDLQGNVTAATPAVTFREPSPVTPTVEGCDKLSAEILREGKQAHVLGTDQALSGISRVQARADFEKSLGESTAVLNPAGRWLIETALVWALAMSPANADAGSATSVDEEFRAEFSCFSDTGPLEPTEVAAATSAAKDGFVSTAFAQEALGVEDTDAESARMEAELGHRNAVRIAKANALKIYVDAGLSIPLSAKLAGFEPDEIDDIERDVLENPIPSSVPGTLQPAKNPDGSPKLDANGDPVMEPVPAPVVAPGGPPAAPAAPKVAGVVPPALAAANAARAAARSAAGA